MVVDGEEEYEVEEIVAKRNIKVGRNTYTQYLVKWLGYPMTEATWKSSEELVHASEVIEDFEKISGV